MKRKRGQKPIKAGEDSVTVSLRMAVEQKEKLHRLGGAKWVRARIERAKEKAE